MQAVIPAVVRPCIEEAIQRSARLLEAAIDHASAALLEDTRKSLPAPVRQEITDAAGELLRLKPAWSAAFPRALRKAMEAPPSDGRIGVRVNPSSLTLVDDHEVEQNIETARLVQQLEGKVDKVLGELDRYMSTAMGLDGIQPEANPLRPAVFAQALRNLMNDPPPEVGRAGLWMRHMAEPLGLELHALYERCAGMLSQANVQAAQYRVVATPGGGRSSRPGALGPGSDSGMGSTGAWDSGAVPAGDPAAAAAISGWMGLVAQRLGGRVLRDFLFGHAQATPQPLAPAYYAQVGQEIAALEALADEAPWVEDYGHFREMPAVERPVREVGTATALSPALWGDYGAPRRRSLVRTRLKQQAETADQVMGVDLVRELVEQVARDPRLLAPVREAIVALEPSLARLALKSPRFFAGQDNPARRLLEGVAQRSFQYNDEFASEFQAFFGPVKDSFNTLNRMEDLADDVPFQDALAYLQATWDAQDRESEAQRQQALEAMRQAEARQAEAEKVAWELSQRSDLDGVPAVVQDFIYGPWALVIAEARMGRPGEVDPGGYARIVADLAWSVKPEAAKEPARAFEAIPRVVSTLRKGLKALGHPDSETETFFRALERLHWPMLMLRAKQRRQPMGEPPPSVAPEVLAPAPAQKPKAREEVFLGENEQRAVGFEDTMPSVLEDDAPDGAAHVPAMPTQPMPLDGGPVPAPGAAPPGTTPAASAAQIAGTVRPASSAPQSLGADEADAVLAGLREGDWVDLFSRQQWQRARLTWAAARGTLFMFVSQGNRPHSMTRRTLQRLVMTRLLRPVGGHGVVQQALDVLAAAPAPAQEAAAAAAEAGPAA